MSTIMMLEGLGSSPSEHVERAWYKIKALKSVAYDIRRSPRDQYHTLMLSKDLLAGAHAHLASIKEQDFKSDPRAKGLVDEFNDENQRFGDAVRTFENSYL